MAEETFCLSWRMAKVIREEEEVWRIYDFGRDMRSARTRNTSRYCIELRSQEADIPCLLVEPYNS